MNPAVKLKTLHSNSWVTSQIHSLALFVLNLCLCMALAVRGKFMCRVNYHNESCMSAELHCSTVSSVNFCALSVYTPYALTWD